MDKGCPKGIQGISGPTSMTHFEVKDGCWTEEYAKLDSLCVMILDFINEHPDVAAEVRITKDSIRSMLQELRTFYSGKETINEIRKKKALPPIEETDKLIAKAQIDNSEHYFHKVRICGTEIFLDGQKIKGVTDYTIEARRDQETLQTEGRLKLVINVDPADVQLES